MPSTNRFDAHSRIRRVVAGIVAAAVVLLPALPADASSPHRTDHHRTDLRVMTQNLYLGSSLAPALTATSPTAFVAAVAQIYSTVQYTDFPRASLGDRRRDRRQPPGSGRTAGSHELDNDRREPASRL
jgi:hypothetical protein